MTTEEDLCNKCFMRSLCCQVKENELSILRDKDIIRPRLFEYCPLKDIVVHRIEKHAWHLADIVDKYQMYYKTKDNEK